MDRVIISDSKKPFFNLAFENRLFADVGDEAILYLWRNSPVVVIGRFQNPWRECNLDNMTRDNVPVMRRDSGGGAVYHDEGNLCFTFIGPYDEFSREHYRAENTAFVCDTLISTGVHASAEGRNDILAGGRKISGSAFREKNGHYIHHGTLLVNSDLGKLTEYLTPSRQKLDSKGIQSVRARVANISEFYSGVRVETVINAFLEHAGCGRVEHVDESAAEGNKELTAEIARLKSRDWNFGHSPDFTRSIMLRTKKGELEIAVKVREARIENIEVFADSIDTAVVPTVQESLVAFLGRMYDDSSVSEIERAAEI